MSDKKRNGGRHKKSGLNYFPLFGELFTGDKMRECERCLDPTGRNLTERLILGRIIVQVYSIILSKGYYLDWNKEEEQRICTAIGNGINPESLKPYMDAMRCANFLNDSLFSQYKILTSRGLQQRWMMVINLTGRQKQIIDHRFYLESDKNKFMADGKIKKKDIPKAAPIPIPPTNGVHKEEAEHNPLEGYTPPVEDEVVVVSDEIRKGLQSPFQSREFTNTWNLWKQYCKSQHNKDYRSIIKEQAAIEDLWKVSDGDESYAVRIMKKSMSSGWVRFFKIQEEEERNQNGNGKSKFTTERQRTDAAVNNIEKILAMARGNGAH